MFRNKDDADCPLWQAPCKKEKCRWWKNVIGTNPNTGETINQGDCAIAFLPFLLIENTQQARQAGASSDKVATEINQFHRSMVDLNALSLEIARHNGHSLIGGKCDGGE